MQYQLKCKSYLTASISGTFGSKTAKAVKKFKNDKKLGGKNPSAEVGEKTTKALKK